MQKCQTFFLSNYYLFCQTTNYCQPNFFLCFIRYPLFQKGNPQLRIFLPNFWMKMIRNPLEHKPMPNRVTFIVSMEMTKYDVRTYLEKIYNVSVLDVRTQIKMGMNYVLHIS